MVGQRRQRWLFILGLGAGFPAIAIALESLQAFRVVLLFHTELHPKLFHADRIVQLRPCQLSPLGELPLLLPDELRDVVEHLPCFR